MTRSGFAPSYETMTKRHRKRAELGATEVLL